MRRNHSMLVTICLLFSLPVTAHADGVDDYIKSEMRKRQIPGLALAVVKNGKVVKVKGYGFANVELDVPVTPDTAFRLGGLSDPFAAIAIMLLVEEGKVGLDDKISKYLPEAPDAWSDITVQHLLTHTAGLKNYFWPKFGGSVLSYYTTDLLLESAAKLPLDFAPGEQWQYSDQGYFLLGVIIERVSGERFRAFVTERIFKALGMTATAVPEEWEIMKNRAAGYTLSDGKLERLWGDAPDELNTSVWSTVTDLAKWDAALYTEILLKKASLDQMWTPMKLNNDFGHTYGFAWEVDNVRGHRVIGRAGGRGVYMYRLPDDKLTVIVLTNLSLFSGSNPRSLAQAVAGRYVPGLLLSSLKQQPDPDPQMTQRLRNALFDIANGVTDSPLLTPQRNAALSPILRKLTASRLKDLKSFTFVACDEIPEHQMDRFGVPVRRVCYYKLVNTLETRFYWLYLTADSRVADFLTNTE